MYKIKFTEYQLNVLNSIDNDSKRLSLMSVYSYLIKLTNKSSTGELTISLQKFHKRYTMYHKKLSLQSIKNRIHNLLDLGLISRKIIGKSTTYSIILSNNVSNNMSNPNNALTTENTNLATDNESCKYSNLKNKDYDYYIRNSRKAEDWDSVLIRLSEILDSCNVRSTFVRSRVFNKISKYYKSITSKHLDSYILRCIQESRDISKSYAFKSNNIVNSSYLKSNSKLILELEGLA